MEDDFEYVVERKPPQAICFGSRLPRNTNLIGKGLSGYQKMQAMELFPNIGPGQYNTQKYKTAMERVFRKVAGKGAGALASNEPRFRDKIYMRTPSPTRYNVAAPWGPQSAGKAPFGSKSRRVTMAGDKLPGPGTYNIATKKCRRTRFMYNFGHPTMIPSIEIVCVSRATDTCVKCEQICAGDYWHKDHAIFLCHLCWEEEKRGRELYNEKELNTFEKIRNCFFAHDHENTTAAIRRLPPSKINKKLRLENYLDLYIKC
ncbi:uncharacterized protein LOC135141059 isoform X2 [Zophobas morio]|uniref:uncharacterized protein LOC135141059 isoform X2 n=1 Tax=Zophobas morio TaxID=2755281 RepID=UPI003082C573